MYMIEDSRSGLFANLVIVRLGPAWPSQIGKEIRPGPGRLTSLVSILTKFKCIQAMELKINDINKSARRAD